MCLYLDALAKNLVIGIYVAFVAYYVFVFLRKLQAASAHSKGRGAYFVMLYFLKHITAHIWSFRRAFTLLYWAFGVR